MTAFPEIRPPTDIDKKRDEKVLSILMEALNVLGGPRKIIEFRNLTWIPSIIKAGYALLLKEAGKTHEEIAKELGVTKATVDRMLRADPEDVMKKISGELVEEKIDEHVAGGLAKIGYKQLKEKQIKQEIEHYSETAETLGVEWAVILMTKVRGLDFPVNKDTLLGRLKGIKIFDIPIEDILDEVKFPVETPAQLLKEVSRVLKTKGKI